MSKTAAAASEDAAAVCDQKATQGPTASAGLPLPSGHCRRFRRLHPSPPGAKRVPADPCCRSRWLHPSPWGAPRVYRRNALLSSSRVCEWCRLFRRATAVAVAIRTTNIPRHKSVRQKCETHELAHFWPKVWEQYGFTLVILHFSSVKCDAEWHNP